MQVRATIALLLVLGSTSACSTYTSAGFTLPAPEQRSAPSGEVEFVESAMIERPYVVLGKVHAHGRCNALFAFTGCGEERLRQMILDEARKLGASAVMDVRSTSRSRVEWRDVHFHGTAIAW